MGFDMASKNMINGKINQDERYTDLNYFNYIKVQNKEITYLNESDIRNFPRMSKKIRIYFSSLCYCQRIENQF